MPREEFQYAVLRVVPRVERGERINAGVVLFSRRLRFLGARIALDPERLAALAPEADPAEVGRHLDVYAGVAAGDPGAGAVAGLPDSDRFHWLVATSSTVIQAGPVHTGLTEDPAATLDALFEKLVA